ncbi:MAG TPA: hypothetical protein VFO72_03590 [Pyrinomonadaceae bacterium]|nr:hypothetical protein [Pyrinomonadaceae bacterium]
MSSLPRIAPVALLLFLCVTLAAAQVPEKPPSTPAKSAADKSEEPKSAEPNPAEAKTPVPLDAERIRIRRSQARSLLIALSTDARAFNDQVLRARSLARIADALWQVDAEQGRSMFRKAWDAAELADVESHRKLQQEIEQQKSRTGGGYAISLPPNLRREVLKLAARHDRALGEEFLDMLKTQKLEAANAASRQLERLNDAMTQRLGVARELLQSGEMERALQFAEPALTVVGMESISFLTELREKNAAAADERYAALLASSANNPQSHANTVSLLSSYIFTPQLFMIFSDKGVNTSQMSSKIVPADVSAELRNAFFQSAAAILLRPLPPAGQDQAPAGLDAKYLVIKRLLPFFEQSAPAEMVESLRAHLNALNAIVSENTRRRDDDVNRGIRPEKPAEEREQSLLNRIDRAKTSAERDALYIQLASLVAGRGDMRARDYVSKVEDSEVRKQVGAYIDGSLAIQSVQKKKTDQALELVQKGDLTHLQKVWVLTRTAQLLEPTDKQKALDLIETAATEARRIDVSDPSRPQALIAVANALKVVDASRIWEATFDAVQAANSAPGFTGEDGRMVLKFQSKGQSSVYTNSVKEFDLEGIFRELTKDDFERAVELARGFEGEGPRAVATIAIARAILEPGKRATAKK